MVKLVRQGAGMTKNIERRLKKYGVFIPPTTSLAMAAEIIKGMIGSTRPKRLRKIKDKPLNCVSCGKALCSYNKGKKCFSCLRNGWNDFAT